ncbi:MAG: sporulation protein YtfJ [Clostridiales bacterium]|nr:sporulation protein YtfJ [Clostridiales bacterium]
MRLQNDNNKINATIETTLKNISNLIDVNTVVGKPIKTEDGEYVVPVSKVTVGVLSGGGEYGKVNIFTKDTDLPFSAGNGAIISVKPCGFLIKEGKKFKVITVSDNSFDKLIDKATDFVSSLNGEVQ